jgi:hypothetical protein
MAIKMVVVRSYHFVPLKNFIHEYVSMSPLSRLPPLSYWHVPVGLQYKYQVRYILGALLDYVLLVKSIDSAKNSALASIIESGEMTPVSR